MSGKESTGGKIIGAVLALLVIGGIGKACGAGDDEPTSAQRAAGSTPIWSTTATTTVELPTTVVITATTTSSTTTPPPPEPPEPPQLDPRFRTCQEALAKGFGPYLRGVDPEYDWYRDADADGVVCESPPATVEKPAQPVDPKPAGNDPRFGTCKEAKANGYGSYVKGQDPEYAWYKDADHDGVVCE